MSSKTSTNSNLGSLLYLTLVPFSPPIPQIILLNNGSVSSFRIMLTSSGSLPAQSCGWATLMKEGRFRLHSTSSPVPNQCGTCVYGCTAISVVKDSLLLRNSTNTTTSKSSQYAFRGYAFIDGWWWSVLNQNQYKTALVCYYITTEIILWPGGVA